jgi:uncharacterized protein
MNNLQKILHQYAEHPDFIGIDLIDINQRGAVDDCPLHIAVRNRSEDEVLELIACGANVNMLGDLGNTPLHFAALFGRELIVKILLDKGANPELTNEFGETALKVAQQGKNMDVIALLLTA